MIKNTFKLPIIFSIAVLLALIALGAVTVTRSDDERMGLAGSRFIAPGARLRGAAPAGMIIHGALHFRINHEPELAELLREQQDERSANYHRWITPEEFGRRFGAQPTDYQATLDWLRANDIKITRAWPDRL